MWQMKSGESHCNHELASDVADEVRRVSLQSGAGKEEEEEKDEEEEEEEEEGRMTS